MRVVHEHVVLVDLVGNRPVRRNGEVMGCGG